MPSKRRKEAAQNKAKRKADFFRKHKLSLFKAKHPRKGGKK